MGRNTMHKNALMVTSVYLAAGAFWILASDFFLLRLLGLEASTVRLSSYQTIKGVFFILVTAVLLYAAVRLALSRELLAEEKLYSAQRKLSEIMRELEIGVYETDAQGVVTYHNPRARVLAGFDHDGSFREGLFHHTLMPDPERLRKEWQTAFRQRQAFVTQYQVIPVGDNMPLWVVERAEPLFDEKRHFNGYVGTITDITPIQERESELHLMQQRVEALLEASPTILYSLDDTHENPRVTWISGNVQRILGFSPREVEIDHWWSRHILPEDRHVRDQMLLTLRSEGHAAAEYRFRDSDGAVHWLRDSCRQLESGNPEARRYRVVGSLSDITSENLEEERRELFSAALASTGEGVIIVDESHRIIHTNPAFESISGFAMDELLGAHINRLEAPYREWRCFLDIVRDLENHDSWSGELSYLNRDEQIVPLWVTANVVKSARLGSSKTILLCRDVSEARENAEELLRMAHYDQLTQLPNRLLLISRLEHAIEKAARDEGRLAVLFLDIDDFKTVNDSFGHRVGDDLLKDVAQRLRSQLREVDTLARLGGDEFVILLEDVSSPEVVAEKAESLLKSLDERFVLSNDREVFVECSLGISLYPDNGITWESLMQTADTAMYRAKREGNLHYAFFTEDLGEEAAERMDLLTALKFALERDELFLEYQPQIDNHSGTIVGGEALLRWRRPGSGVVSPGRFIPIAEATGMISRIGTWALNETCRQLRQWLDDGHRPVSICVNISARHFRDQDLISQVREVLQRHELPGELLGLEITESALMERPGEVVHTMRELRKLGVQISLDDFGTGFSSFAYLTRFTLDVLKIDMSFIAKLNYSEKDNKLVATMIDIAEGLGLRAIAEGVESIDQYEFLRDTGCHQFQGHLYSPPVSAREFIAMLDSGETLEQRRARRGEEGY